MKLKKYAFLPLLSMMCLTSCGPSQVRHEASEYKAGEIRLIAEKEFSILQLNDIHLSNKDNQELQLKFLGLTLSDAKQKGVDLIVLCGDVFTFADKATVNKLFDCIESYEIPWTITFGNHDEQCYFSVSWLTDYLNNYGKHCIFKDIQDDDVYGHANFYIDVINSENEICEKVYIFDSNRYHFSTDYFGYDYIKEDQVEWYKRMVDNTALVPSLAFFHIPLPEFETAYDLYKKESPEVIYHGGSSGEGVSDPKYNSGLFDVMVSKGSTKGVFCAHDHENDLALEYQGILLSYGVNSTDRIYSDDDKTGGQIIKVKSDKSIELERIYHKYSEVDGK